MSFSLLTFGYFSFFVLMQNTIIDERGSFAVTSPFPGPLATLLRSIKKVGVDLELHYFPYSVMQDIATYSQNFFPPPSLHSYVISILGGNFLSQATTYC